MELQKIIQDVYEALGEPSDLQYKDDLDNIDITLPGWLRLVDTVNAACLALSVWKFPDGRTVRFRYLEDVAQLETIFETVTLTQATTNSNILTVSLTNMTVNFYAGFAVKVLNTSYRVRYSQASTLVPGSVDLMIDATISVPTATAVEVSSREYFFANQTLNPFTQVPVGIVYNAANGVPLEIIDVFDLETNSSLNLLKKYDPLIALSPNFQIPSQYYKLAKGLRFESFPNKKKNYAIRYVRGPKLLTYALLTAEPELPEQFHGAIVLYCLWWGYRRMQENDSAYATKQDLVEMLRRIRTEYDLQGEYTSHQFTINMGE